VREITHIPMADSTPLLPARRVSATIPARLWRGPREGAFATIVQCGLLPYQPRPRCRARTNGPVVLASSLLTGGYVGPLTRAAGIEPKDSVRVIQPTRTCSSTESMPTTSAAVRQPLEIQVIRRYQLEPGGMETGSA
jgi:hypothetical protein